MKNADKEIARKLREAIDEGIDDDIPQELLHARIANYKAFTARRGPPWGTLFLGIVWAMAFLSIGGCTWLARH